MRLPDYIYIYIYAMHVPAEFVQIYGVIQIVLSDHLHIYKHTLA